MMGTCSFACMFILHMFVLAMSTFTFFMQALFVALLLGVSIIVYYIIDLYCKL